MLTRPAPRAVVLSLSTPWPFLALGEITHLAHVPPGRVEDVLLEVAAGFCHLIFPGDYRSAAGIVADREQELRESLVVPKS